jgi:hypothetical protein
MAPELSRIVNLDNRVSSAGDRIRTERFAGLLSYTEAFSFVSDFYTDKTKSAAASDSFNTGRLMPVVLTRHFLMHNTSIRKAYGSCHRLSKASCDRVGSHDQISHFFLVSSLYFLNHSIF